MRLKAIRLFKEQNTTFIVKYENLFSTSWHYHPEYELLHILKGRGERIVGDHIDKFKENDLVLLGPNLPHIWHCDRNYYNSKKNFAGEAIAIYFSHNFLGDRFMEIPENYNLVRFLNESIHGCELYGLTRKKIMYFMKEIVEINDHEKLYTLFKIFHILSTTVEYNLLASPGYSEFSHVLKDESLMEAHQYILKNFRKEIKINDLLDITNMSLSTFYVTFKKIYQMSFKDYLLHVRIGHACHLLLTKSLNIAEIGYDSGFENISNFNRQFKRIKRMTPSTFRKQASHISH